MPEFEKAAAMAAQPGYRSVIYFANWVRNTLPFPQGF
jgi:hypothetical protein